MDCIFCGIVNGSVESYSIYADEHVIVILDINPVNLGHCLIISKKHYRNIFDAPSGLLSHMMIIAQKLSTAITKALGADGVNIIMTNNKAAGQAIMHLHIHVIPRFMGDGIRFGFRHKKLTREELIEVADKLRIAMGDQP